MKSLVKDNLAMVYGGQCSGGGGSKSGGSVDCTAKIYEDKNKAVFLQAGASADAKGRVHDKRAGLFVRIPFR